MLDSVQQDYLRSHCVVEGQQIEVYEDRVVPSECSSQRAEQWQPKTIPAQTNSRLLDAVRYASANKQSQGLSLAVILILILALGWSVFEQC
jgi:hypothetical protein